MWLWLRKKLPKSFQLWSKLSMYVGGLHLLALFALFFVYKGDYYSFSLDLNRHIDTSAAVVFLPLKKRAGTSQASTGARKSVDRVEQGVAQKSEEKAPKASQVKAEKATTLSTVAAPKKKKKALSKKSKKVGVPKKAKEETAKPTQEKPEQQREPEVKAEPKKIEEVASVAAASDSAQTYTGFENVQYLGQLDLEVLQMQEAITSEIQKYWKLPPGIAKSAECRAHIIVSWEGVVKFSIEKSSGVAIYDVTARNAMLKASLPKQLWGKEFSITFKQ